MCLKPKITFDDKSCFDGKKVDWMGLDEDGNWASAAKINKHWKLKSNQMKQCKKQTTYAVIYKDGQAMGVGTNQISEDITECPRDKAGFKSGKGYHLCKEVCRQAGHAEEMACRDAGKKALGGTLYLIGHTYCCDNCIEIMANAGIFEVVLCDVKENNRFSPVGAMLAKKYEKMNIIEFMDAIGLKTVEP